MLKKQKRREKERRKTKNPSIARFFGTAKGRIFLLDFGRDGDRRRGCRLPKGGLRERHLEKTAIGGYIRIPGGRRLDNVSKVRRGKKIESHAKGR